MRKRNWEKINKQMKLQRVLTILLQNCFQARTSSSLAYRCSSLFNKVSGAFSAFIGKNETISNKKSARLISGAFCQKCVVSDVVYWRHKWQQQSRSIRLVSHQLEEVSPELSLFSSVPCPLPRAVTRVMPKYIKFSVTGQPWTREGEKNLSPVRHGLGITR